MSAHDVPWQIKFIKHPEKELLEYFEPHNLPVQYGGTSTFEYDTDHLAPEGVLGILDPDRFVRPKSLRPGEPVVVSGADLASASQ